MMCLVSETNVLCFGKWEAFLYLQDFPIFFRSSLVSDVGMLFHGFLASFEISVHLTPLDFWYLYVVFMEWFIRWWYSIITKLDKNVICLLLLLSMAFGIFCFKKSSRIDLHCVWVVISCLYCYFIFLGIVFILCRSYDSIDDG